MPALSFLHGFVFILFDWLVKLLPALVAKVATSLGLGYVTYELGSYGVDSLFSLLKSKISGLPADALMILDTMKFDTAISIILGGMVAAITMKTLCGDRNRYHQMSFGFKGGC